MLFRRLALLIAEWAPLVTACGSSNGPTTAALPTDPRALPRVQLADNEQAIGELRGTRVLVNIWAATAPEGGHARPTQHCPSA